MLKNKYRLKIALFWKSSLKILLMIKNVTHEKSPQNFLTFNDAHQKKYAY